VVHSGLVLFAVGYNCILGLCFIILSVIGIFHRLFGIEFDFDYHRALRIFMLVTLYEGFHGIIIVSSKT
jgi:hypothetical protein